MNDQRVVFTPINLEERAPGLYTSGKPNCRHAIKRLVQDGFRAFVFVTPISDDLIEYLEFNEIPTLGLNILSDDEGEFQPTEKEYKDLCQFLIDHWPAQQAAGQKVLVCCDAGITRSVTLVSLFLRNFPHLIPAPER